MASENGRHVPGTPDTYKHGWIPVAGSSGVGKFSNAELLDHAETMYGTGSKQHIAAFKKFGPGALNDDHPAPRRFPEIHKGDLSTPDARRSPAVSPEAFQAHAARGKAKIDALDKKATEPIHLHASASVAAYKATRKPWGGVTIDAHTGEVVDSKADAYALSMRDPEQRPITITPNANGNKFMAAMRLAQERFKKQLSRPGAHLGVFYDADTKKIEFDPTLVTSSLSDVHDIGAYTRSVGGAYHFKSGNGFWPPHVEEKTVKDLAFQTPAIRNADYDLTSKDGKIAFWKQILPLKSIDYTARDGARRRLDFTRDYLADLASSKAVDKIGFLLADKDNAHTMDPERWRGEVESMEVRDDGLYGKIIFSSPEAAAAVLANPNLGVSARIREGVQKSDGSTVSRGIIHVLGTLDPQIEGMSPWQPTDLSSADYDVLDLSSEEYHDMATPRDLASYTDEEIEAMTDEALEEFLAEFAPEFAGYTGDETDEADEVTETTETEAPEVKVLATAGADMSKQATETIDLANQAAARATARAEEALQRVADAEWRETRAAYMAEGVPPSALDLAAPVLHRADDMVIDLSNRDEADVNVSEVVRGLLDSLKGTVDLSNEAGHLGTASSADDPDTDALARWAAQD